MSDTVKSIFRQKEVEKIYELSYCGDWLFLHKEKNVNLVSTSNTENVISDKVIGTYDIEIPMLEVGDEFFLCDIQELVKVKRKMRSSDGSITYYVEDKVVETENTKKTYAECRQKIEHYKLEKEKFEDLEKKLKTCKEEFEKYKRKYKYKNRFFNRKCLE